MAKTKDRKALRLKRRKRRAEKEGKHTMTLLYIFLVVFNVLNAIWFLFLVAILLDEHNKNRGK